VSVQQGYDPRDFALMGFGGAGSLHSNAVAKLMGSYPVIVPTAPGVLCAAGDATTQMRHEHARSFNRTVPQTSNSEIASWLTQMQETVIQELEEQGVTRDKQTISFEAGVRYKGQGFEVSLPIEIAGFADGNGIEKLEAEFDEEHKRLFTFNLDVVHEVVNLRAIAVGQGAQMPPQTCADGTGDASGAKLQDHKMWVGGQHADGAIYDRAKLRYGDRVTGPAIIVEMDSTALILPDHVGEIDRHGNILINPAKN